MRSNTDIMIYLMFALILLLFFVSWGRKWEINPKRSVPWSIAMTVLGSLVLAVQHNLYPDSPMAVEILIAGIVPIALTLSAVAYLFFRDPDRIPPQGSNLILSPADGRLIYVNEISNGELPVAVKGSNRILLSEFTGQPFHSEKCVQLGIAMSVIDVHVNRAPIAGRIVQIRRIPGSFKSLKHLTSLLVNERVFTQIDSEDINVGIVQIASRLVRRIDCYLNENDCVSRGDRIGIIKFGSQVDLLISHKDGLVINVKVGDDLKAGRSVIGSY